MERLCFFIIGLFILLGVDITLGQTAVIGRKVHQVSIRDSHDNPVPLPGFGEKNLLIFYPDPDHGSQNQKFTDYLEKHPINSENILSYGIVNLKDAPLIPNAIVRSVIRNKVKKTGAAIYTDPDHLLRDAWELGDVNDLFTIIFVTQQGKIAFLHKGEMSDNDIKEFYRVIDKYR